ncbi:putative F-box protein [Cardamine amara subsp. amara]|uniref:F-box protein n=1 Tax=Cardamine amara subsp. amara TaxID=228776 RepID=A0ABD0ZPI5_CARAN
MDKLPWLVLNEILFRLDRKAMARMRCTNKDFRRHMSEDPYFEREYKSILFPISNHKLSFGDLRSQVLGCCSGLLLLFVEELFVVNAITWKYRLVNYSWSRLMANMFSSGVIDPEKLVRIGFVVDEVDPNTQRFKIICLIEAKEEEEARTKYQFEVTSGDSFWTLSKTTITCHSSKLVEGMRPVYLNQVLYWLRNDGSIITFNTVTEEAQLLQTELLPNSRTLFCMAPGLTLLAATEEGVYVYALENTFKWVLVRRIPNEIVLKDPRKRMMSWKVAAYDGKFIVLTETTKDVMVVHEYDLRANKWQIIQSFSNCNTSEEFFQLRPSSSSVIGLNNLIGMENKLLLQMQPRTSELTKRLFLFLKDMFPRPMYIIDPLQFKLSLLSKKKLELTPIYNGPLVDY